ncbi:restriction endonuclease subunit S [Phormidium sp. FACHB-1136]|uniref:restriction endonuclease subunit S n=1 Tax=Phormidium sp. FACHB-1136 TaxID=2692848 RepID=UPI001682FCD8|nr:restriction endonuclease subunit S [Phormidium sp. FACHB-1136]MBD2429082.1 restriction endonuclease subunit S [Phormidium sp. FACHB-1136]
MSQFDELPEGWVATTVGEATDILDRLRIPLNAQERASKQGPYPYYGANGKVDSINEYIFDGEYTLIAEDGGYFDSLGKDVSYRVEGKFWVNNHAHIIQALAEMSPKFITYLFNDKNWMPYVSGTTRLKLTQASLKQVPINLPPLNEQRRIVEKIEALTARSRKAREALEAIPNLLDQFRQSVLAAAFRGDLTADWREQNPDVEPAEVLLERIRVERRRLWETSIKLNGESLSKYKIPFELDINRLPELPESWTWGSLDQLLFSLRNGLSRKPADDVLGIPILRISALRPMTLNINDIRYYQPIHGENVDSYLLKDGDLLFTRYNGNRDFVGICGIVKDLSGKLLYPDKLIRGKPISSHLFNPSFLKIACNSGVSRRFIDECVKTSAGQHGISGSDLKRTPIPIPPIDEQYEIMSLVNEKFGIIDNLRTLIANKFCEFQVLDQSILARAFRGELVPQDPNDEPANLLLERIRAERERLGNSKKRGKAKT